MIYVELGNIFLESVMGFGTHRHFSDAFAAEQVDICIGHTLFWGMKIVNPLLKPHN